MARHIAMEVQRLTQADMNQVRKVWKICFGDSDAFLDVYFETVANVEDGIGFFDNGQLVSDLFEITMNAEIAGMVYQSEFLAGCATMPEARKRHLMRNLIHTALSDMHDRGVCVSFLHPFLHAFYRKFGYETVNYVQNLNAEASSGTPSSLHVVSSLDDLPLDSLYASYQAYVSQFGNYFMRSRDRMEGWLKLLFADGGQAAFIDSSRNTPYALFYPGTGKDGGRINRIFELVYFTEGDLATLTQGTGQDASYFLPCSVAQRGAQEFTMMRIVRPDIMLQSYPYEDGTQPFVINIHDPFLGRDYNLNVVPKAGGGAYTEEVETPSNIVVGIGTLARLFTGTYSTEECPGAAEVFRQHSSCYFDTY